MEMEAINESHIWAMRRHLYDGKAALFVGAGFSKNAQARYVQRSDGFKNWNEVTEQLSSRLWDTDRGDRPSRQGAKSDPLWVAQLYEEEFGVEAFYHELRQAIPYESFGPSDLHRQLLSLDWSTIITTNLDTLLEDTLDDLNKPCDVIVRDMDISLGKHTLKLYKMHGCIKQPSTIVFTEEQYRRYESDHPLLAATIKALFAQYTVVFIGFSLTDPNFRAIYGWVRDVLSGRYQRKAYALVASDEIGHHARQYWTKRNVILLPIDVHPGTVDGYSHGLEPYLQVLGWTLSQEAEADEDAKMKAFREKYWGREGNVGTNVNFDEMKRDLARLPEYGVSESADYVMTIPIVFHQVAPAIRALPERERYEMLAVWSKVLPPGVDFDGTSLTDYLVNLLSAHGDWDLPQERVRYLLQRANFLIQQGRYSEAEAQLTEPSEAGVDWPASFVVDRLWVRILRAKLELDLPNLESLAKELERDGIPDDPVWFNRLGNVFRILGDFSRAIDYFRRAESGAKRTRNEWQQHVAHENLSKFWDFSLSHPEFEQQREMLSMRWSSTAANPLLRRLEELQKRVNQHAAWKQEHGYDGWSSEQRGIPGDYFILLEYINSQGLPDDMLTGDGYERLVDLLFDGGYKEAVMRFAVFGGSNPVLQRVVDQVASLPNGIELCDLAFQLVHWVSTWLDTVGQSRNPCFARKCLMGALAVWCALVARMSDEQIGKMTVTVQQLFDRVIENKGIDDVFASLKRWLWTVCGQLMVLNPHSWDTNVLQKWIDHSASGLRWFWPSIPWNQISGQLSLAQDTVKILTAVNSFDIIRHWLAAGLLDDETRKNIFDAVYSGAGTDTESEIAFYLLDCFRSELADERAVAIISAQVDRHAVGHWASEALYVHQLARLADLIPRDRVGGLLSDLEQKIDHGGPWDDHNELVTAYLILLNALYCHKLLPNRDKFFKTFESTGGQLTERFEPLLGEFQNSQHLDKMVPQLTSGLAVMDPAVKQRYLALTGQWLAARSDLSTPEELSLWKAMLGAFFDSNAVVVVSALRAATTCVVSKPVWLDNYLTQIAEGMKMLATSPRTDILAQLAGLYRALEKTQNPEWSELWQPISHLRETLEAVPSAFVRKQLHSD